MHVRLGRVGIRTRLVGVAGACAGALGVAAVARRCWPGSESDHTAQARLLLAQEEERKRIAAGIHDDPLQHMAALSLRLQRLRRTTADPELAERLLELEAAAVDAAERLRHLLFELHPPTLEQDGLAGALELLCAEAFADTLAVGEVVDETTARLGPAGIALAYRATREVVLNARNHAHASRVEVRLRTVGSALEVQVRDDGRGMGTRAAVRRPGHLGLPHVADLLGAAGGSVRVDSIPGKGTTVTLVVPALDVAGEPA